jgi:hypothetical protein
VLDTGKGEDNAANGRFSAVWSPASNQMEVKMKNQLPPSPLHIKDQLIPRSIYRSFPRHIPCFENHFQHNLVILVRQVIYAPDVPGWENKKMNRGMGPDIFYNDDILIPVKEIGGLFSTNDLAENALFHVKNHFSDRRSGFHIITPAEHSSVDIFHILKTFLLKLKTGFVRSEARFAMNGDFFPLVKIGDPLF